MYIVCNITLLCCAIQMFFNSCSCLVIVYFRSSHFENDYLEVARHVYFHLAVSSTRFPELSFKLMGTFFPHLEM